MHHRTKTLLTMLLPAAVVVLLAAVVVLLRTDEPAPPPDETAKPGISVTAKELHLMPEVSKERRRIVTSRLQAALERFYVRAFIVPPVAADAAASPAPPGPLKRIHPQMTSSARAALKRRPEIFETTKDLSVFIRTVVFSGVVTMDGSNPIDALLDVDFNARATPVGRSAPLASLRHVGTMRLKRTASLGWLVDGFDLKLRTKPLLTPSPSPR